jgi:hypothetical protein
MQSGSLGLWALTHLSMDHASNPQSTQRDFANGLPHRLLSGLSIRGLEMTSELI